MGVGGAFGRRTASGGNRRWMVEATAAVLFGIATLAFFVQIERGLGNIPLSLLFVAHDVCLAVSLGCMLLLWVHRRWSAAVGSVSIIAVAWFASWLKMQATGLPALASDLPRLLDAWAFVRPFAGPAIAAALCLALVLTALYVVEKPLAASRRDRIALSVVLALAATGVWAAHSQIPEREVRFVTDRAPKLATLVRSLYARPAFDDRSIPALGPYCCFADREPATLSFAGEVLPNIVIVLQESTFPPERLHGVAPAGDSLFRGSFPLVVDTVGGGTWVQEYAVLHGVAPPVYGADFVQILGLGPERGLRGRLAPMLRAAGYRTLAVLPYSENELLAGTTYRTLGFDRIDDCSRIAACRPLAWSDVPDAVLYDHALEVLQDPAAPAFVYLSTIRQHSPHGERYPKSKHRDEILAEYLRRLELSATEASAFLHRLGSVPRPTIVLMFGDHIPADVHEAFPDSAFRGPRDHTYFNLYDTKGSAKAAELMSGHPSVGAVSAAFLDAILLKAAGFESDYIDRKLSMLEVCRGQFCVSAADEGN